MAIGLFDYYREQFTKVNHNQTRLIAGVLALGVPLVVTLVAEETFVHVLGFAGIFLSILADTLHNLAKATTP